MNRDEKTLFYLALFLVIVFFIVIVALFQWLSGNHIPSAYRVGQGDIAPNL